MSKNNPLHYIVLCIQSATHRKVYVYQQKMFTSYILIILLHTVESVLRNYVKIYIVFIIYVYLTKRSPKVIRRQNKEHFE